MCPLFKPPKTSDEEDDEGGETKKEVRFSAEVREPPVNTGKTTFQFPFGKPTPLFASQKAPETTAKPGDIDEGGGVDGKQEAGEDAESFVPDAKYEPVIPLPALVEVKTGEEEEEVGDDIEVLVQLRCKLYRFEKSTKENKERGAGEIKILHNTSTGRYRCVMRRDTTLKLCANFAITPALLIIPKPNAPAIYTWGCRDHSDGAGDEGCDEIFTARFKDAAAGAKFLETIKKIPRVYYFNQALLLEYARHYPDLMT